jgi:hypothetical protein
MTAAPRAPEKAKRRATDKRKVAAMTDDLAEEHERLAWIATCTAAELQLMLPWLMTDPLGFDEQRARIERARAQVTP